jgi:bifunctional NMN adenylyltransferase/nudix hydrolase
MRYVIYADDFSIFTINHYNQLEELLNNYDKVICLITNAYRPRTINTPFTYLERMAMINNAMQSSKITIAPVYDHLYDVDERIVHYVNILEELIGNIDISSIAYYNTNNDISNFLSNFLRNYLEIESIPNNLPVSNAKEMIELWLTGCTISVEDILKKNLPHMVYNQLLQVPSSITLGLKHEQAHIKEYRQSFSMLPYPIHFMTADAIVRHRDCILMIQRKRSPGKGLWALPGGFVDEYELTQDAAIRELEEEAGIKLSSEHIKNSKLFDYPYRSNRGRTYSMGYYFNLPYDNKYAVTAADDAAEAKWMPIADIEPTEVFEDHYDIIRYFVQ